jgi:S1-C subfamily serine protease
MIRAEVYVLTNHHVIDVAQVVKVISAGVKDGLPSSFSMPRSLSGWFVISSSVVDYTRYYELG